MVKCNADCSNPVWFQTRFLPVSQVKPTLEANVHIFQVLLKFPDGFFCVYIGPLRVSAAELRWVHFHPQSSSFCLSSDLRASSTRSRTDVIPGPGRRVDQSRSPLALKSVWVKTGRLTPDRFSRFFFNGFRHKAQGQSSAYLRPKSRLQGGCGAFLWRSLWKFKMVKSTFFWARREFFFCVGFQKCFKKVEIKKKKKKLLVLEQQMKSSPLFSPFAAGDTFRYRHNIIHV